MSPLIKSPDVAGRTTIRAFEGLPEPPPKLARADPLLVELSELRGELRDLRTTLAAREAEIAKIPAARDKAFDEGKAKGRDLGLAEAASREADRLARLDAGIVEALDRLTADMASMEGLAVALAREGLAQIIGEAGEQHAMLVASLRRQIERLQSAAIIKVMVSQAEFSAADLEALRAELGRSDISIVASHDLSPGDCRIKLQLGELEVGPRQQWRRLDASLAGFAPAEDSQ